MPEEEAGGAGAARDRESAGGAGGGVAFEDAAEAELQFAQGAAQLQDEMSELLNGLK